MSIGSNQKIIRTPVGALLHQAGPTICLHGQGHHLAYANSIVARL